MTVRIGTIELTGLQQIRTQDARNLVQQRGPGQAGSVAQDLGREPVVVLMEGLLLGDDPRAALEELRQAQTDARPLAFAADAIAGAELTDVLIEDLQIRQLAGYRERYRFHLRVREYTEPPEAAAGNAAAVDGEAAAEAETWTDDAVAATDVLADPSALATVAANNPGALAHLEAAQLSGAVQAAGPGLDGGALAGVLGAIAGVAPDKLEVVLKDIFKAGGLADLVAKVAGVDLGAAASIVKAMAGGADFLTKLEDVARRGKELAEVLAGFDPGLGIAKLAPESGTSARDVVSRVDEFVVAVDALFKTDTVKSLADVAKKLGIGAPLSTALDGVVKVLQTVDEWMQKLEEPLDVFHGGATLVGGLLGVLTRLGEAFASPAFGSAEPAGKALAAMNEVATVVRQLAGGLPRYAEEVEPVRDALAGLLSTAKDLKAQIGGSP